MLLYSAPEMRVLSNAWSIYFHYDATFAGGKEFIIGNVFVKSCIFIDHDKFVEKSKTVVLWSNFRLTGKGKCLEWSLLSRYSSNFDLTTINHF